VCLGASIVRDRVSVDFVEILRRRHPGFEFVNAGVNSNVAYELMHRLDPVIACRPAGVVILVGTNDVEALDGGRCGGGVPGRRGVRVGAVGRSGLSALRCRPDVRS